MTRTTLACAFLASVALAAPAPIPQPGMTKEQEALVKASEKQIQEASELLRSFSDEFKEGRRAGEEIGKVYEKVRVLNRQAAETLARVDGALAKARAAWEVREPLAMKAARAWQYAGEHSRALAVHQEVIRLSTTPRVRVEALYGAYVGNTQLGRPDESRRSFEAIRKELPRLKAEGRTMWEALLQAEQHRSEAARRRLGR